MTVLIQRGYEVPLDRQEEFERLCSERRWPDLQSQGVPMVGYGSWTFGGRLDEVTAHLAYADLAHLEAVHAGGALAADVPDYLRPLISSASARVIELSGELGGVEVRRSESSPPAAEPAATFGVNSIISERTYLVATEAQAEFPAPLARPALALARAARRTHDRLRPRSLRPLRAPCHALRLPLPR